MGKGRNITCQERSCIYIPKFQRNPDPQDKPGTKWEDPDENDDPEKEINFCLRIKEKIASNYTTYCTGCPYQWYVETSKYKARKNVE